MKLLIKIIGLWLITSLLNLNASQEPCDLDCGSEKQTLIFSGTNPILFENDQIKVFLDVSYTIQECQDGTYNISILNLDLNNILSGDVNNLELSSLYKFVIEFALKNLTSFNGSSNAKVKVPCYNKTQTGIIPCDSKSCCDLNFNYTKDRSGNTILENVYGNCNEPDPSIFKIGSPVLTNYDCSSLCFWQTNGNDDNELPHPTDHFIGPTNGSDMIFKTGGQLSNNSNKEVMRLTAHGNLGIGVSDPSSRLGVAGNVKVLGTVYANELIIEDTDIYWPDYVFKSNYERLSLEETEKFINDNGHLPKVPSEKDISKHGISIKDMNLLMMEKIEELTLELIDLNKELQALKKEVE